ncbi:SGNH/GDSL hydrolase family protein [uncultured Bacteroides sp.]|uniref:SGNH/GDSL hydrolase family protein n=1 Tax=uncultured Bacteroides sp. TaxID=162156 RepID=UPI0025E9CDEF|nr:SGNH/GDSL hydrolase family protein [uncultured Bacteroides sp.]
MKCRLFSLCACLLIAVAHCLNLCAQTRWYNPLEDASLPLHGRGWNAEIGKAYARLPLRAKETVPLSVWNISRQSPGLYVKFHTNATDIRVKYKVSGGLAMVHMPATGVSGVDLYTTDADGNQYWCAGRYHFSDTINYHYEHLTYRNSHHRGNEYCLYLPLYNKVEYLEIGVPAGCRFDFVPASLEKPVVVYGTSIVQGACASRPGMAWTNIVQRKLDTPVVNLGFSGSGQLEEEMIAFIAELDASLFVIDCMPNMTDERTSLIKERTEKAVRLIRSKSQAPILLVEHDGYMGYKSSAKKAEVFMAANKELQAAYQSLKDEVKGLHYMTFEEQGLSMDSQVDGVHATDLGMQQYADAYTRKIKDILYPEIDSLLFKPCRQYRDANVYQWDTRHEEVLKYNAEHQPEIVMTGNSITHYWGGLPLEKISRADDVWQKLFKGRKAVNMGFGWDKLENITWRIVHGELDGFSAKKIFMMLGTNNLLQNSNQEIVTGITQIVKLVKSKQPDAQLYVVKILPRRGFESRLAELNHLLSTRLSGEASVEVLDFSSLLQSGDGKLKEELFSDGLHPNRKGYEVIAKKLSRYLK